ncbi:MAG: hypothetical protein ACYDA7_05220 [Acidithiobacillus sp.]
MIIQPKPAAPGWAKRWTAKWLSVFRTAGYAFLEITGYAMAIFLAEMLVKTWSHQ